MHRYHVPIFDYVNYKHDLSTFCSVWLVCIVDNNLILQYKYYNSTICYCNTQDMTKWKYKIEIIYCETHMFLTTVPGAVEQKERRFFFFFSRNHWCHVLVGFRGLRVRKLTHRMQEHVNFILSPRERQQHINCYMVFYPTAFLRWLEFKRCWRLEAAESGSDEEKQRLQCQDVVLIPKLFVGFVVWWSLK